MRKAVWPAVFVLLAGIVDSRHLSARGNPQRLKPVILNLIVTDHAGNPVADLVQSDFRVVDNGSVQRIASLRTNAANSTPPLVILFDLLNLDFQARGAIAQTLRQSMARLPRQLAAEFNRVNIVIYTLDPGLNLATLDRNGLDILSTATGGRTFASSDLNMAVIQAQTDARSGYILEYDPPLPENWEGKFHKVQVSCGRKGLHLRNQQFYLAEASK